MVCIEFEDFKGKKGSYRVPVGLRTFTEREKM